MTKEKGMLIIHGGHLGGLNRTKNVQDNSENLEPLLSSSVVQKPDFAQIESLVREMVEAKSCGKYLTELLEVTEKGKVVYQKTPTISGSVETVLETTWSFDEFGISVDFINAKPVVKTNKNKKVMKNEEVNLMPDADDDQEVIKNNSGDYEPLYPVGITEEDEEDEDEKDDLEPMIPVN